MLNRNLYTWVGLSLLVAGSLIFLSAYFIFLLAWLTALGVAMIILSLIFLVLGRTIPKLPPEVGSLLLETGIDNMSAIVEELGIKTKAVYLPSALTSGRPQALIPLHSNSSPPSITSPLPRRLIVRYGANPDDIGLLVATTGTTAISMLESIPDATSAGLESALTSLFMGVLAVADGTKVTSNENHISVEIRNPRIENNNTWSHYCLGGPLASVVASVAAEAWGKPITISQEECYRGKHSIKLEVMG